jgi:hypothetical protein
MCDVDLMVPGAELPRARAVLLDMGCVQRQSEDIESRCREWAHLREFFMRNLTIELHWTITPQTGPVRMDAAGLWDRARPATTAGVEVLALSPEDLLLHLCLHFGYYHHFEGLKSFFDIAATIHHFRGEMDWGQFVHLAREWGAARYVGLTAHLARSMLDAEVPDDVLEQLVPGGLDQHMFETARQFVLTQTDYRQWMPTFDVLGARSLGAKAKLSWKRVFLSRDEMVRIYPASRDSRHRCFYFALRVRDVTRTFAAYALRRGLPVIRSRGQDRNVSLVNWLKSGKP